MPYKEETTYLFVLPVTQKRLNKYTSSNNSHYLKGIFVLHSEGAYTILLSYDMFVWIQQVNFM